MKTGLVICGPDVAYGPLALLSGTFSEKVAKAARLGFDGIELMVRDPAGLDWAEVKATLDANGLEVGQIVTGELFGADGLGLCTSDGDLHRRTVARLEAIADLAAYLGTMVNIGRSRGRLDWLSPAERTWSVAVERLREVVAYAARQNVRIAVEPINRYEGDFIHTTADGLRMIADLGYDNLGLMLDVFHMNIEEPSIEAGLAAAGDRLWHVHIADSNRCYPGSGHLPFDSIFATLYEMGYDGYVSAEILPWPDPDTAAERTIAFLRERLAPSRMPRTGEALHAVGGAVSGIVGEDRR
jgi:sugar phosphate isomerase/epimerase